MRERPRLVNDSIPKPLTRGIKATYSGTCQRCKRRYNAGDFVRKFGRGWACCR